MQLQELKVGKSIEVYVTRDGYRYHLVSKVEGTEAGKVYVSLIAAGSRLFAFKPSDKVELVYKEKERIWKWTNVKPRYTTFDGYQVHCFESPKGGESFNRRDTFRVQIMKAMEVTRYSPMETAEKKPNMNDFNMDAEAKDLIVQGIEKSIVNVVVKDISESGIGFYSPSNMKEGDKIRIRFMSDFGMMMCEGTIIRAVNANWNRYRVFYGCIFDKTDKNLSKYIYAQQRLQLKRERK